MRAKSRGEPDVSVVVPVVERYGDLKQLYREFSAEIARLGFTSEFLFVVDDHQKGALPQLRDLQREDGGNVVIVTLGGTFGE
ncbi:MAG TPA: hypothetical protein VEG34_00655, partial [Thermoanaerobaculia bacterium]|nr:hypothetical protein [Thermoanaerobaculia bacterium]